MKEHLEACGMYSCICPLLKEIDHSHLQIETLKHENGKLVRAVGDLNKHLTTAQDEVEELKASIETLKLEAEWQDNTIAEESAKAHRACERMIAYDKERAALIAVLKAAQEFVRERDYDDGHRLQVNIHETQQALQLLKAAVAVYEKEYA